MDRDSVQQEEEDTWMASKWAWNSVYSFTKSKILDN